DNAWIERDNDGYTGFKEAYGYEFKDAKGMDVALMYEGIANGDLDVVTIYTVDPQLKEYDLKVLEDEEQFFTHYEKSLIAKKQVIEKDPTIDEIIESIVEQVSIEYMTELIYKVDIEKKDLKEVATEFL